MIKIISICLIEMLFLSHKGMTQANITKIDSLKSIYSDIPTKDMFVDVGFAPIFIKYSNFKQAYNFFVGIGIKNNKDNLFCINYFQYDRFHPEIDGYENDRYFSVDYYFIKNNHQKIRNHVGLQLGYLFSYGSSIPIPYYYPDEIETYKMKFYSIGITDQLQFRINKKHAIKLMISLDIGVLNQSLEKKNKLTGEILYQHKESFVDAQIFKPLIFCYSYKF